MKVLRQASKASARWFSLVVLAGLMAGTACAFVPQKQVEAAPGQPGPFGTRLNYGYFYNRLDAGGLDVIPGGLNVSNVNQLISAIRSRALNQGGGWSTQNIRGAQFIVQTMRGGERSLPNLADVNDWEQRVRSHVASGGTINFNAGFSFNINSYYQDAHQDNAYYNEDNGAYVWHPWSPDPDGSGTVGNSIVFYNASGSVLYAIRRACGNPVSGARGLPPAANFSLTSSIVARDSATGATVTEAEPGQTINFTYRVTNSGSTNSFPTSCTGGAFNRAGYFATPGTPEGGGAPIALACTPPRVFPPGTHQIGGPENIVAAANTTYCRTLFVTPSTRTGGTSSTEVCIPVVAKPYMKVFGGDISAGAGFESAPNSNVCSSSNSGIVSWNKGSAGGYAGAGTQLAAQSLALIRSFASAQGAIGGAIMPVGLSFSNTGGAVNLGSATHGGNFGTASCITDYYGKRPASALPLPVNISAMVSGAYGATGNQTFTGGNINPGEKTTVYIDGDVYIDGNITYTGSWNTDTMPLFQMVVRGNIYVDNDVTQLDGVYVAQPRAGAPNSGTIYTCTTSAGVPSVSGGSFFAACNRKLTVNGAFVAHSVEFLRTSGTLRASPSATEASSSGNIAEVFNFGPAFWMAQPAPTDGSRVDKYDAINSLPPVL